MNRFTARPFLAALRLITLCLVTTSCASAQELLNNYRRASAALGQSVDVFATDQVESLDALRRAKAAFAPLADELEPPLRRGLTTTFESAEAAIVNQSETDLRVQAAVLRGGFQRTLYSAALEGAASGDQPRARKLLNVLATDIGMAETTFDGATRQALQTAFEGRLAALSLTQLDGLGDDRESRYEVLAGVYSHLFLVQDSPRLPEQTQTTLLGAVQALVTGKPLAPPLKTLRAQLTEFRRAAQDLSQDSSPAEGVPTAEVATGTTREGAVDSLADDRAPERMPNVEPTPDTKPDTDTTDAATKPAAIPATAVANTAPSDGVQTTPPTTRPDPAAPSLETTRAQPTSPERQTPVTTPPATAAAPLSPTEQLAGDLREPLRLASGSLALVALLGLVFSRRSPVPWRDTALALLLLPVISEGLIALAPTLTLLLEPYLALPLGELGSYSLFTNPLTQLAWMILTVLAALCLMLSWRAPGARSAKSAKRAVETASKTVAAAPPAMAAASTAASTVTTSSREKGAHAATVQTLRSPSNTLTTGSGFDWDEDF